MQVNRLPPPAGAWLDRSRQLSFTFDGRRYEGLAGDTLASALAANDVWLLSRSFKYHRARGIQGLAGHDAGALLQLPQEPNAPADRLPLTADLTAMPQNVAGSLRHDRAALLQHFSRFLPVGFYYKAFYWPRGAWQRWWEPLFRRMAGLGRLNEDAPPPYCDARHEFCDVAVAGGGAAGLSAAAAAASAGLDTLLIDENPHAGGALNYARFAAGSADLSADMTAAESLRARLMAAAAGGARLMTDAAVTGFFADNTLSVMRGGRLRIVRARRVILAPGGIEQPLVFHNNDLPGVLLAGAALRLIRQFGVRPGKRAVVATGNAAGYGLCLDLLDAGVTLAAVADLRPNPPPCEMARQVEARGVKIWRGHAVFEAHAGAGGRHVAAAALRPITARGECGAGGDTLECDLICTSVGDMPAWHLPCLAGGQLDYDELRGVFAVQGLREGVALAGAANGAATYAAALQDGAAAARRLGIDFAPDAPFAGYEECMALASAASAESADDEAATASGVSWNIFPHPRGKEFVDFDEDLQVADIAGAAAEGYDHVQLAKRYSTAGMGPSQGRHAALSVARILAGATGQSVGQVGITTARPPITGEKLGALAGRHYMPERRSAMHHLHAAAGARFMPAGLWQRPAYYGAAQDESAARRIIEEEALAVRRAAGLVDVSTLGGLEICGADAGEFLNRLYTGRFDNMAVGQVRYAVMLDETGVVIDDGVACRLHEQMYYVTATSAGADNVYRAMLKWSARWRMEGMPALEASIANVTSAWAAVNVAGPGARDILRRAGCSVDLSGAAFGYMRAKTATVAGIAARLLRVGFVGESGFEVHVPATYGAALWQALCAAGAAAAAAAELRPFGVEAQRLLRLEKGHLIVGQDTDSQASPLEVGLHWAVAKNKEFFVGGRALQMRSAREGAHARRLVGFELPADAPRPRESCLLIIDGAPAGRVTSCAYSPTLQKVIGLAFAPAALAAAGNELPIRTEDGEMALATVVKTPFYDPEGLRQKE